MEKGYALRRDLREAHGQLTLPFVKICSGFACSDAVQQSAWDTAYALTASFPCH